MVYHLLTTPIPFKKLQHLIMQLILQCEKSQTRMENLSISSIEE